MFQISEKSKNNLTIILSILAIFISFFSLWQGNNSNIIANISNNIAKEEKELVNKQTKLIMKQILFEELKNKEATFEKNRKMLNQIYDNISSWDIKLLPNVHRKIKNNIEIEKIDNLDIYIDQFENIWDLFCKWKIKKSDLDFVLKRQMNVICNSNIINNEYSKKWREKNWLYIICKSFNKDSLLWKIANDKNCKYY